MTTFLESSGVSPPVEVSLPLTFFDIVWLHFLPMRRLLFYDCACSSRAHFLDTILPRLKQSLSLTLRHYLPVAGYLYSPLIADDETKPFIRYVPGDSVRVTIAESSRDYDELVGNHARDADQFYDFVPQMPPIVEEQGYNKVALMAIQVTLFPGHGICIGFANHHTLGDASSIVGFIRAWAAITKLGVDEEDRLVKKGESSSLPVFDRSVIKDPLGVGSLFWKTMRKTPLQASSFPVPTNRVRATYTLHPADIKKLKDKVLAAVAKKSAGLMRVSSFVVTASYVWTCLIKSWDAVGEEIDGSMPEYFVFVADTRGRIDPPVPANYFGNCVAGRILKMEHCLLVEDGGFVAAAEAIMNEIRNKVDNKEEVLKGVENWMSDWEEYTGVRVFGVSGSPRYDLCGADFGWGRARKLEMLSIDEETYSMSLCRSGLSEEALEVGLSLPDRTMKAFAAIFAQGLTYE